MCWFLEAKIQVRLITSRSVFNVCISSIYIKKQTLLSVAGNRETAESAINIFFLDKFSTSI